ncbi:SDR family NAD(P)-dependent oxidoreductase [Cohnella sp. JJ-181]|uniref:SDR family NAD(P)-dependent oxidoreductase n=1 Tax=Cohnella rhizoplanae TaxID=2974897 RepID=UPI0022FF8EC7|nr:SDR family NAD(P)-dependent oxidoreductase [Cohnella sp. JJ-181]CAI6083138.1 3-phenylpropionate-dihydrodiol/cinnamic acid-dihydrodiol dehydrogenase [Cohnella sp. JJ-181]
MSDKVSDKVWMVTGSSRGLGREIAVEALRHGDRVVATARDPAALSRLVDEFGDSVFPLKLDVTNYGEVLTAVEQGVSRFGKIDVLVNNAGYANLSSIEDMEIADFQDQVAANFLGVVYTTKAVLPGMRERGRGSIINISSVGGRIGTAGLGAYQSAKFAVNGFAEVLAKEVASLGIKVTAVEPGGIATDWAGSSMKIPPISEPYRPVIGAVAAHLQRMNAATPEERVGQLSDPAKIAAVVRELTEMTDPPVRLLLGTTAYQLAQEGAKRLAESDMKHEALSRSTVYTD